MEKTAAENKNTFLKITEPTDIPGWTHNWQHDYFPTLLQKLPYNSTLLEVGCGYGRSTWAWLDHLPNNFKLDILDNFTLESINEVKHKDYFYKVLNQHFNSNLVRNIFHTDYYTWKQENKLIYDLVYLDSDHSYEIVKDQLEYFKDTPILCGDDYEYKHPGVVQAVDEFAKKYSREYKLILNFFIFGL